MKTNGVVKFEVKAGVQLPPPQQNANRKYDWPFGTMKVGECFYFPIEGTGVIAVTKARGIVMRNAKEWRVTGRRFATRAIKGDKYIGVWRIA